MNTSEPLTPEERELARLLGRPAAGIAPSARIDAAIATLAREPAASAPAPRPSAPPAMFSAGGPTRRGWRRGLVSSLAVAASLVLVVGLAWQLRPAPPALPAATLPAPTAAADARDAAAPAASVPAPAPFIPAPGVAAAPARPAADTPARKPAAPSRAAPSPVRVPVAPAPPPPAAATAPEPAASTYALEPAPVAVEKAAAQPEMRLRAAPAATPADAPVRTSAPALREQARVAVVPAAPAAVDADADARLPRRQWLERIRARRAEGDLDGARASLERFVQTYPEARIPRDLRPLLGN